MKIAIIQNGVVVNIIIAEAAVGNSQVAIPGGAFVDLGYLWDGSAFSAPIQQSPELTPSQQAAATVSAILEGLREQGEATLQLRGTIAVAWSNINDLLDLDRPSAIDAFDALVPSLPPELQAQAPALRSLLAAI